MIEPCWVHVARKYIGQAEVPGAGSNSWIKSMWLSLKGGAWFWKNYGEDDSKLPWCGGFMAFVVQECGYEPPKNYASAKAWLDWGSKISVPVFGAIVIFTRDGGGHVGIIVGRDRLGRLMVLGANQQDSVRVSPFSPLRVSGYVLPPGVKPDLSSLPMLSASDLADSWNEA